MYIDPVAPKTDKEYSRLLYDLRHNQIPINGNDSLRYKAAKIAFKNGEFSDSQEFANWDIDYKKKLLTKTNVIKEIILDKGQIKNVDLTAEISQAVSTGKIETPEEAVQFVDEFVEKTNKVRKPTTSTKKVAPKKPVAAPKVPVIKKPVAPPKVPNPKPIKAVAPPVTPKPPKPPKVPKPKFSPVYGPQNKDSRPAYGPENQPPINGPQDHPVYGPDPFIGPNNKPINGPQDHPNRGQYNKNQERIKYITDKIRSGYSKDELEMFDLREELTKSNKMKNPGSTKEEQELASYFINRINDIVNDIVDATTSILKINLERIKHLRDDAKKVLSGDVLSSILSQLDKVEKVINRRLPIQQQEEADIEASKKGFVAFLKRNQVDLISIVAGITAHNRTALWLTRYALRRRENRLNKEEKDRQKATAHDDLEKHKLQTDRLGLRGKLSGQNVSINGLPNSNISGLASDSEIEASSGQQRKGKSKRPSVGKASSGKGGGQNDLLLGRILNVLLNIKASVDNHFSKSHDEFKEEQDAEDRLHNSKSPTNSTQLRTTDTKSKDKKDKDNNPNIIKKIVGEIESVGEIGLAMWALKNLKKLLGFGGASAAAEGGAVAAAEGGAAAAAAGGTAVAAGGTAVAEAGVLTTVIALIPPVAAVITTIAAITNGLHGLLHPNETLGDTKEYTDSLGPGVKYITALIDGLAGIGKVLDVLNYGLNFISGGFIGKFGFADKIKSALVQNFHSIVGEDPFKTIVKPMDSINGAGASSIPGQTPGTSNKPRYKGKSQNWSTKQEEIKQKIITEAQRQGIDPGPILALVEGESSFQQTDPKTGKVIEGNTGQPGIHGGYGVFQFTQDTARDNGLKVDTKNGVDDRLDEDKNIQAGITFYKKLDKQYDGDTEKIWKAYKGSKEYAKYISNHNVDAKVAEYAAYNHSESKLALKTEPTVSGVELAYKTDDDKTQDAVAVYSKPKPWGQTNIVAPTNTVNNNSTISMNTNIRNDDNSYKQQQTFDAP